MGEERDGATPREEMDEMVDALITFAQQQLEKHGEFYPFGAAIKATGELEMVGAYTGKERPPSAEVIDTLYDGLGKRAWGGEIRASGVCFDVRLQGRDEGDAIEVALEHMKADPVNVFLPYAKGPSGPIEYRELFATRGERRVFA
jgi:hypothetical protein